MFCRSRASRMRPGRMSMIRACPWAVSVMIPACEPVYEAAGNPRSLMAMASSDMAIRSPAVRSMSSSRRFGNGESRWAIASSSSVVWPIAETTTTTSYPSRRASTTRSATAPMRSTVSTEVPPYFWTMTATCRGYRARMPRWALLLDLRGSAGRSFLLRPPPPGRRRRAARVEHAAVQDGVPRPNPPPDHHTDALKAADHEDGEDGHGHGDERARLPLGGRDDRNQRHRHRRGQPGAPGRPARHDEQTRHHHLDRQQHQVDARGRRQPPAGHLPRVEREGVAHHHRHTDQREPRRVEIAPSPGGQDEHEPLQHVDGGGQRGPAHAEVLRHQDVRIGLPRPSTAGRDQLRRMLRSGDDERGGDRSCQVSARDPEELCPMHCPSLALAWRWATRSSVRHRTFDPSPAVVRIHSQKNAVPTRPGPVWAPITGVTATTWLSTTVARSPMESINSRASTSAAAWIAARWTGRSPISPSVSCTTRSMARRRVRGRATGPTSPAAIRNTGLMSSIVAAYAWSFFTRPDRRRNSQVSLVSQMLAFQAMARARSATS